MDDLAALDWSAAPSQPARTNGGRSPFDYLATQQQQRASPTLPLAAATSKPTPSTNTSSKSSPSMVSSGDDAFSSLFGTSPKPAAANSSLSMAERLARQGSNPPSSLHPGAASAVNGSSPQARTSSETWDFDLLSSSSAPSTSRLPAPAPSATPSAPTTSVRPASNDLFSFDGFEEGVQTNKRTPSPADAIQLTATPPVGDDFDLLSDFVAPPPSSKPPSATSRSSQPSPRPTSRAPSPPPHVLGQLVAMGFGIDQARTALAATYGADWDVQAAAEALMGAQDYEQRSSQSRSDANLAKEEAEKARRHAERRRPTKSRAETPPSGAMTATATTGNGEPDLLAQASEIGLNVFKSASSYWQTGRKAVQKAVEERMTATPSPGPEPSGSRRPKWMTSEVGDEVEAPVPVPAQSRPSPRVAEETRSPPSLFKDSDDEGEAPPPPLSRPSPSARPPPVEAPRRPPPPRQSAHRVKADAPAQSYVSPHRRLNRPPPQKKPVPARPVAPPRRIITATPSQIATAEQHRLKGNDLFKLGRYADASTSYTSALDVLPPRHLSRVPLLTNRAQASLHNGEPKPAIEDCTTALLFLGALHALTVQSELESAGKALGRRAKAYEAAEKWSSALDDWTLSQRSGGDVVRGAGGIKVIAEGVTRCKRMVGGPATNGETVSKAKPRARPVVQRSVQGSGAAVKALKAANDAADAEDAQRLALKDTVDARLASWKGGKETNLRALIASLDSVLWDGFGWQKVGLHELVTENQVKIRYVKAIARLHPDKLSPASTTLEQRMIANGVFGALSDAWNARTS